MNESGLSCYDLEFGTLICLEGFLIICLLETRPLLSKTERRGSRGLSKINIHYCCNLIWNTLYFNIANTEILYALPLL